MVSLFAKGDAERIVAGALATTDVTALNAMLTQVDSLKSVIHKILASHTHPTTPGAAHPATPADTPEKTSAALATLSSERSTLDLSRSANANSTANDDAGDKNAGAADESAMRLD